MHTREGYRLTLTADHRVRKIGRRTRWSTEWEWAEAGTLKAGDEILLHDHHDAPHWGSPETAARDADEGYLLGLLIGDGVLKSDKAVLSVWPGQRVVNGSDERPGIRGVMNAAFAAAERLPHRADFKGWMEVPGRGEWRLSTGALKKLALDHGLAPRAKHITAAMERRSRSFQAACLRGLFDADGCVIGSQQKGVSVRLAQSDLETLEAAQRMLLRLGIACTIYRQRRPAGSRLLPDGRGGSKSYATRAQHELAVSGANLSLFSERIGFSDTDKATRLVNALGTYRRELNRESFVATVGGVEPAGEAEVFDAAIPGLNAFDANGLWAHNCGEQPLPPYGACLLGSINLAKLVDAPFTDDSHLNEKELARLVRVAIRFLDNVIDISRFPLPEQRAEAFAKRRIGLGVTGLADALIFCRARYGSPESLELIDRWLGIVSEAAYEASAEIAQEKGAFPLFDARDFLARPNIMKLSEELRARHRAVRNPQCAGHVDRADRHDIAVRG